MADALLRAPNTQPRIWVRDPTTLKVDSEFCRKVFIRQVEATGQENIWIDPFLSNIFMQSKYALEHRLDIKLVKEKEIKTR